MTRREVNWSLVRASDGSIMTMTGIGSSLWYDDEFDFLKLFTMEETRVLDKLLKDFLAKPGGKIDVGWLETKIKQQLYDERFDF